LLLDKVRQLPNAKKTSPTFLYLHLMSAHGIGTRQPRFAVWSPASSPYDGAAIFGESSIPEYKNFYDNGVLQTDAILKELLQSLTEKGYVTNESVVLITGDHGESLGDNGVITHAQGVHESVLRILKHLGASIPANWSGVALQAGNAPPNESVSMHIQAPYAAMIGYISGNATYKYVRNYQTNTTHYFDLQADPKERKPLATLSAKHMISQANDFFVENRLENLVTPRK
jgi:hypothetical protein